MQVLRESWDVENKSWFYVTPPDVTDERILPGDPFHWTGITQNWNTTCADCHSTNVHKNYNPVTNQYSTTFSEINVSCEECHGPGSVHVELGAKLVAVLGPQVGYGLPTLKDKNLERASRNVREVPCAAEPGPRGLSARASRFWTTTSRSCCSDRRLVPREWSDSGRGL